MTLGEVLQAYPASLITVALSFIFLWLSLYILRVNPDDTVSKLASGTLFIIFLYQFSGFLVSTAESVSHIMFFQRTLWLVPFAPVLWLQLVQASIEPPNQEASTASFSENLGEVFRANAVIGALYGIAASFIVVDAFTNSLFNYGAIQAAFLPLKEQAVPTGPVYILCTGFMLVVGFIALMYSLSSRDEQWWLLVGSTLFVVAAGGSLVQGALDIRIASTLVSVMLETGVLLVAIGILRYKALLNKEVLERDAVYVSVGTIGIAAVYAAVLLISQGNPMTVPIASLALIVMLALSTHMLADSLKVWFSKLVGTRLGLVSESDVDMMEQLYHEASKVKRQQGPFVELFDDGNETVDRLLGLLTPRQHEIITCRAKGFSDKQIADELDIKLPTVRKHIEDIKERVGTRDKADCAVFCVVTGLLNKDDLVDWFDSLSINGNDSSY